MHVRKYEVTACGRYCFAVSNIPVTFSTTACVLCSRPSRVTFTSCSFCSPLGYAPGSSGPGVDIVDAKWGIDGWRTCTSGWAVDRALLATLLVAVLLVSDNAVAGTRFATTGIGGEGVGSEDWIAWVVLAAHSLAGVAGRSRSGADMAVDGEDGESTSRAWPVPFTYTPCYRMMSPNRGRVQ